MPVLIITPDITAETWLGAAGCASGSQTCSGKKPALVPNPTTASRNATLASGAGSPPRRLSKSSEPPWARSRKNASRNAVPRCVATR